MANSPLKLRISCISPSSSFFGLDGSNDDFQPPSKPFIRTGTEWDALAGEDDLPSSEEDDPEVKKNQEQILQLLADASDTVDSTATAPDRRSAPLTWQEAATKAQEMLTRPNSSTSAGQDDAHLLGEGEELYEACSLHPSNYHLATISPIFTPQLFFH